MVPEKRPVPRRKVNKRTYAQKNTGFKVAKGFWISLKVFLRTAFIVAIIAICIVSGLLLGIVAGCIITTEPLTEEELDVTNSTAQTSFVYDSKGVELVSIKGSANENRQLVEIEEVPKYLSDAFVAIEDERFYTHDGIDLKRTVAAFIGYVVPSFGSHGGSTITQQVVKNVTGDNSRSVPRKLREQWRAMCLENELEKDEIMELYMNVIFMGQNLYGVRSASLAYFNKDVSKLNLAECAFLAGITNSPGKYNPLTVTGRENCFDRQVDILDKMLECGFITDIEYIEAIQSEIKINDNYKKEIAAASIYSYFVDAVLTDVKEAFIKEGYTKEEAVNLIYQKGIKIYTTQNSAIQKIVDEEYCNEANFPVNHLYSDPDDMAQSSIVIMDQATGHVLAMYGGYGKKTQSLSFNYATSALRQPGSAIKPLLVYGPLVDQHVITSTSIVNDHKVYLDKQNPDKPWPINSYKSYYGPISIKYALQISSNVAAVVSYQDHVKDNLLYLKKLGIDRTEETHLSMALGGFTTGVTTEQMCAAYVPFANGGTFYEPITFTHVKDAEGNIILMNDGNPKIVYENTSTAPIMTDMLKAVVTGGTGTAAQVKNALGQKIPTAGKTGTTTSNYDYWFCGYTPYYTCAVWYGYEMQKSMTSAEKGAATKLFSKVMSRIHKDLEPINFEEGEDLKYVTVCKKSNLLANDACKKASCDIKASFPSDYVPKKYCNVHKVEATPTKSSGSTFIKASPTPNNLATANPTNTPAEKTQEIVEPTNTPAENTDVITEPTQDITENTGEPIEPTQTPEIEEVKPSEEPVEQLGETGT